MEKSVDEVAEEATSRDYSVPAVIRCFTILEVFKDAEEELSLSEIAQTTGIHKTTTFRILYTLEKTGFVVKTLGSGKYHLGPGIFELAGSLFSDRGIVQLTEPFLVELMEQFNETADLAIRKEEGLYYAHLVESLSSLRMVATVGTRAPFHASALGKSVAAFLPEAELRSMVLQKPLTPFTENTITDAPVLRIELEEIRARGYSIDDEEVESGAKCIGAPILDYLGEPVAALSVSGPVSRINRQQNEIIKAVTAAAEAISRKIRFSSPRSHQGKRDRTRNVRDLQ